jgi:hypothetical protein
MYLEFGRVCILDDSSEAVQHPRGDIALHLQPVLDGLAFHAVTCPQHLHCTQSPRCGMLSHSAVQLLTRNSCMPLISPLDR